VTSHYVVLNLTQTVRSYVPTKDIIGLKCGIALVIESGYSINEASRVVKVPRTTLRKELGIVRKDRASDAPVPIPSSNDDIEFGYGEPCVVVQRRPVMVSAAVGATSEPATASAMELVGSAPLRPSVTRCTSALRFRMQNKIIFEDDGAKTVPTMCVLTDRSAYNRPPPPVLSNATRGPQSLAIAPAATIEKRECFSNITFHSYK